MPPVGLEPTTKEFYEVLFLVVGKRLCLSVLDQPLQGPKELRYTLLTSHMRVENCLKPCRKRVATQCLPPPCSCRSSHASTAD